jgi:hypothetical protein
MTQNEMWEEENDDALNGAVNDEPVPEEPEEKDE